MIHRVIINLSITLKRLRSPMTWLTLVD